MAEPPAVASPEWLATKTAGLQNWAWICIGAGGLIAIILLIVMLSGGGRTVYLRGPQIANGLSSY
jgi:hypothetical protein